MADVDMMKIKAIYKSLVALQKSIRPQSGWSVLPQTILNYEKQLEDLKKYSRNDYSQFKARGIVNNLGMNGQYDADEFLQILSQLIGLLDGQFNLEANMQQQNGPIINIDNSNRNEVTISFKTIQQVIQQVEDTEVKQKLEELDAELIKDEKDIGKVKNIVIWLANKAWDIFLVVAPYILQSLGKGL
jgi:hypothetical protein